MTFLMFPSLYITCYWPQFNNQDIVNDLEFFQTAFWNLDVSIIRCVGRKSANLVGPIKENFGFCQCKIPTGDNRKTTNKNYDIQKKMKQVHP
jgi:hypothetical protein